MLCRINKLRFVLPICENYGKYYILEIIKFVEAKPLANVDRFHYLHLSDNALFSCQVVLLEVDAHIVLVCASKVGNHLSIKIEVAGRRIKRTKIGVRFNNGIHVEVVRPR